MKLHYLIFAIILFMGISFLRTNLSEEFTIISKTKVFIPPSKNIKYMTFGFEEIVADSLWLRWIQNIETCGKKLSNRGEVLKSVELKKSTFANKLILNHKKKVCDEGWAFRMLDAVTDLSPKFRMPYAVGASNLSIITEDHIGAKKLYEKALKAYPNDWKILYRGAYHFLFELNDLETAGKWLQLAADNGAPDWLYSLSSRVYSQSGQLELGIRALEDYIQMQTDEVLIKEIKERILVLKSKLNN